MEKFVLIWKGLFAVLQCCFYLMSTCCVILKSVTISKKIPKKDSHRSSKEIGWRYSYSSWSLYHSLRTLNSPYYSFLCDVINHVILLLLLVIVATSIPKRYRAVKDEDGASSDEIEILRKSVVIAWPELMLWLCLLSRILIELYQMCTWRIKKYFKDFWNWVDIVTCLFLLAAFSFRIKIIWQASKNAQSDTSSYDLKKLMNFATYIYS